MQVISKAPPPTSLDRLYRFFRHDDPQKPEGATWSVSASSLEQEARMYRYAYSDTLTDTSVEEEITIGLKKSPPSKQDTQQLVEFYLRLRQFARDVTMAPYFRLACLDLIVEDPWMVFIGVGAK